MKNLREKICFRIKGLRKALKLTQFQFAEKVGLSEEYIRKIEHCKSTPSFEAIAKIADRLNLSLYTLLDFDKQKADQWDKALDSIIALLQTRNPEDIKLLHEIGVKIFEGLDKQKKTGSSR